MLAALLASGVLLVSLAVVMGRVQEQVRVIGDDAAPRAATASELYFALSDLDAQVARLVLVGGEDAFAGSEIDALAAYRERGEQIDAGLQRAAAGEDRQSALRLVHQLAVYRQWVWQALTVETAEDALGYYTQATNTLHLELLPSARALRDAGEERLTDAYAAKQRTEIAGISIAVLLGGTLLVLLIRLQLFLTRRFRRLCNPALIAATALTAGLVVATVAVLVVQGQRLGAARDASLTPYLALSQARALSYDAAADTGRYLLDTGLGHYREEFDRKAEELTRGGSSLAELSGSAEVAARWQGYQKVHERVVALADDGKRTEAIATLTGIRRGDAAFDFYAFDTAVSAVADERQRDFAEELRRAEGLLAGWVAIPAGALAVVLLLVPLGVRRRLAEFR